MKLPVVMRRDMGGRTMTQLAGREGEEGERGFGSAGFKRERERKTEVEGEREGPDTRGMKIQTLHKISLVFSLFFPLFSSYPVFVLPSCSVSLCSCYFLFFVFPPCFYFT